MRAASVLALMLALVTACSAAPASAPSTPTLPDGVSVAIVQLRGDVALRQAQVQVTNGSDEAVVVAGVAVEDPRFEGPATRVVDRVSTIPAGGRVDIKVQLPPVACPQGDDPLADAAPEVVLELGGAIGDGGSAASVRTPADDPLGFIAPLHERECRAKALADAATLAFTDFSPSPAGEPATLELTVTPSGAGRATIVAVQATNLLDFGPASVDGAFPLDIVIDEDMAIDSGTEPLVIELPIVPFRCDPHAVQEDKRGTIFDVRLELDGEPGEIELFVGDELRGRILTWVAQWCDFGGGA
jgi:hypothetical protein